MESEVRKLRLPRNILFCRKFGRSKGMRTRRLIDLWVSRSPEPRIIVVFYSVPYKTMYTSFQQGHCQDQKWENASYSR